MEAEKLQVNLGKDTNHAELVIREGAAVKVLEPKAPIKQELSGVIGVPYEYLLKRVDSGQFEQERSHLIVNREKISLSLVINEHDEYTRGVITGKLEHHPKFLAFGINSGRVWTPTELGMFFKMNHSFFTDRATNMKLVHELKNFTATINNKIEKSVKESGDRTDHFAQVVNSNLPESFTLVLPIFKGTAPETLEVETFAQVNGREVSFVLISPGAQAVLETIRDSVIDEQLTLIKQLAPDIAIIEQ